jgi:hypothetical protein
MKKEGELLVLNIAYREKDHVTLGEEGLGALRLLLGIGRSEHRKYLKKQDTGVKNEWSDFLCHADKYVERLMFSAKKVIVEVDWDKWADIEKKLEAENRRLNK